MSKIVISTSSFDTDNNPHIQDLTKKGLGIASNSYGRKLTEDEVIALLGDDTVGMVAGIEPLTERVFASARSLKVVSRCGSGLDSVDLAAAKRYGITVLNTPEAPAQAVAELTLALILAALRQIPVLTSSCAWGNGPEHKDVYSLPSGWASSVWGG